MRQGQMPADLNQLTTITPLPALDFAAFDQHWDDADVPGALFYWWEPDSRIKENEMIRVEFEDFNYCPRNRPNGSSGVTLAAMPEVLPCDFKFSGMHKAGNSRKIIKPEPWDLVRASASTNKLYRH